MRPRLATGLLLVILAATPAACSRPPARPPLPKLPAPSAEVGVGVPIPDPKPEDAARLRSLEPTGSEGTYEVIRPKSVSDARDLFPETLLPKETLGRRLIAIVFRGTEVPGLDPQQELTLLYEGGLAVVVSRNPNGGPFDVAQGIPGTVETTEVAGTTAQAELVEGGVGEPKPTAQVSWKSGELFRAVRGEGLTKADVVALARSLAP